jgi:hypothetical protein
MALTVRHLRWLGIPVTQRAEVEAFFRDALGMRVLGLALEVGSRR